MKELKAKEDVRLSQELKKVSAALLPHYWYLYLEMTFRNSFILEKSFYIIHAAWSYERRQKTGRSN